MNTATVRHTGLIETIRQFTPNWFTTTMGTGILALSLGRLPTSMLHDLPALLPLAETLWLLNIALFAVCSVMYGARWLLFPQQARRIVGHGSMSMFFGAPPMGLATIVNGLLMFGIPHWGAPALAAAHALWWVDAALAVAAGLAVPYWMFTRQDHRLESMTALWLMPVVACVVSAASGGLLVAHLPAAAADASRILWISYALWGMTMLPAMGILAVLFLRLALHKLPEREMAASSWLALGPVATGALGLLTLGDATAHVLAGHDPLQIGAIAHGVGVLGAALLWGFGAWWFVLASLFTVRYVREGLPFNLGWWAFTFPIGNFVLCSLVLGGELQSDFFVAIGIALTALLAAIWLGVATLTLRGVRSGQLFFAPCLAGTARAASALPL